MKIWVSTGNDKIPNYDENNIGYWLNSEVEE